MPRTFVWHPSKGPRKTEKQNLPETGTVRIKQVRSGIGHSWRMRATLEAIGLKHHQDEVVKAITPGRPVTAYSAQELVAVVRWLDEDGTQRTDDELLRAAMKELGFARLGPRIKEALGAAVAEVRG